MSILSGSSRPRAFVLAKKTFEKLVMMCRCFEYPRYTKNDKMMTMCVQSKNQTNARCVPGDIHVKRCDSSVDTGVHARGKSEMPFATRAARRPKSVAMIRKMSP